MSASSPHPVTPASVAAHAAEDSVPHTAAQPVPAAPVSASSSSSDNADDDGEMQLPEHNSTYKKKEYWDERFSKEEKYEWLSGYASFRDVLRPHLRASDRILHIGCGNSDLARDLYLDGFRHIVNVDFSAPVVAAQRARNADCPEMSWEVCDLLELGSRFPPGSFDVVLDKCTLDALLVDEGDPWNPRPEVREQVSRVLRGISSVLRPEGGKYLQLSFGQPIHRRVYFEARELEWELDVSTWGAERGFGYFFYNMTRTSDTAKLDALAEQRRREKEEEEARVAALQEQLRRAAEESEREQSDEQRMMFAEW